MITLGIDTSTAATSVALLDGDEVIASEHHVDARAHAEVLAPLVAGVLRASDRRPDLVAVGVGPGPYTGLRVGVATARTLGLTWGIPVVGVCSLDALAAAAIRQGVDGAFVVATDARRKEVYWASYDTTGSRVDGPFVGRVADIPAGVRALPWVGEGVTSAPGNATLVNAVALAAPPIPDSVDVPSTPDAADVARLAVAWVAAGVEPAAPPAHWSEHGTDDGSTARSLAGLTLLQPYPLYVRRADAIAPAGLAPTTVIPSVRGAS